MGLLDALKKTVAGGVVRPKVDALFIYTRCNRCGEVIRSRIDKGNELSRGNDGFTWRKELIGSSRLRCFQRVEVVLEFDNRRDITERRVYDGELVTEDDYDVYLASLQGEERRSGEQTDDADDSTAV